MNNHFEHLIHKSGEDISLTREERARARALLAEYAAMKPVRRRTMAPAPRGWIMFIHRPAFASVTVVALLFVGSGGVAYGAEGTLPGDLLYRVKVGVTEPIVSALATRGERETRWQMTIAERRVHEAAVLAKEGRLDADTETALATRFVRAAEHAAVAVAEDSDPVSATVAVTGFVTRLDAYDHVLKQSADGTDSTKALRSVVSAQRGSWHQEDTTAVASTSSPARHRASSPADAAKLERKARAALHDSADTIDQATASLNASSSVSANEALQQATDFAEEGHERLKKHDDEGASKAFRASIGATARLDVLTRAASSLQIDAFENKKDDKHDESDE